jgi:hypothetical protein
MTLKWRTIESVILSNRAQSLFMFYQLLLEYAISVLCILILVFWLVTARVVIGCEKVLSPLTL